MTNVTENEVDRRCMTRTNIDIDDALIADVMRRFHLKTKREAVDVAELKLRDLR
jgi:Arc/MetJ family transcription regulator